MKLTHIYTHKQKQCHVHTMPYYYDNAKMIEVTSRVNKDSLVIVVDTAPFIKFPTDPILGG